MDTMVKKLNELHQELRAFVNNEYDDYTGREENWTNMEELKAGMYGDAVNLILSIECVLEEYEKKSATN